MTKDELEQLDDRGMDAWRAHDTDAWVGLFAEEFVWNDWTVPEPIRDKDGARVYFDAWMKAFPDMHVKTVDRVVGDSSVAAEIEFSGTNTGPLSMGGMELPPTGKPVVGRGTYFVHVRDGKIVEFHSHPDAAGMMMQLGMMPSQ